MQRTIGTTIGLLGLTLLGCAPVRLIAQVETVSLRGRVVEADGLVPVEDALVSLGDSIHRAFTDADGRFRIPGVEVGTYLIAVEHLGFGRATDSLDLGPLDDAPVEIRLARRAIELRSLSVEALSREELERRSRGTRRNVVTRAQIEEMDRQGLHLGDVLDRHVPGISVEEASGLVGLPFCVEFRRPPSLTAPGACQPPLVVVDRVPVFDAAGYLSTVTLSEVESVEVLGPAEAGTFYGSRGAGGVVRVETRRPGTAADEEVSRRGATRSMYDWRSESGGHPWKRALTGATLGATGALGLVLYAAGDCSPLNEGRAEECPGSGAYAYGAAAFVMPVLGAAAGANYLGRTEESRGEFLRTALLSATPMLTGYFFAAPQGGSGQFSNQALLGKLLVVVGVPAAAALADRLFRDPIPGKSGEPRR